MPIYYQRNYLPVEGERCKSIFIWFLDLPREFTIRIPGVSSTREIGNFVFKHLCREIWLQVVLRWS